MKSQFAVNIRKSIKRVVGSRYVMLAGIVGSLIPLALYAASEASEIGANGMYHFVAGTIIDPDEVNANFDYFANTISVKEGNVGIGTTTPASLLNIYGGDLGVQEGRLSASSSDASGSIRAGLTSQNDLGNYLQLEVRGSADPGTSFGIAQANMAYLKHSSKTPSSSLFAIGTSEGTPLLFGTYDLERMRITSSGNVGIGTESPESLLHLQDVHPMLRIEATGDDGNNLDLGYSDALNANYIESRTTQGGGKPLAIRTNTNTTMWLGSNSNVGIGTTDPMSRLAVAGLPSAPPSGDSSGTRGVVCITNAGNMWVDDDGVGDWK